MIDLLRNLSNRKPSALVSTSLGIWLRNSNFSRTSWMLGEKPSRYASKSARSCCCFPREARSRSRKGDVL